MPVCCGKTMPLVVCTCMTALGGSALDGLRDGGCADRQRDLVVYEGKPMAENVLPDLGIQQALTGNQGIYGTQEHAHIFPRSVVEAGSPGASLAHGIVLRQRRAICSMPSLQ